MSNYYYILKNNLDHNETKYYDIDILKNKLSEWIEKKLPFLEHCVFITNDKDFIEWLNSKKIELNNNTLKIEQEGNY